MPAAGSTNSEPDVARETQITIPDLGFFQLVWSDYRFNQGNRPEPVLRLVLLFLPRLLLNPSLQLAFLVRVAQCGPGFLHHPVRWLQIVLFSSEFWWFKGEGKIELGEAIAFPHPIGVLVGPRSVIGSYVSLYNNLEIGSDRGGLGGDIDPARVSKIGDRASIYPYSNVLGPYTVGHDAVIGLGVTLDQDIPPGALKTKRTLKLAGEWDDSHVQVVQALKQMGKHTPRDGDANGSEDAEPDAQTELGVQRK
jgi:serine acetyltransferase